MAQRFGTPISSEQFAWFCLKEINSPVVSDLATYSTPGYAIQYCKKDEVWNCLSSGEKRLVDIAWSFYSGSAHGDEGILAITGLDLMLRRKVWIAMGYLILGHDILKDDLEHTIDWDQVPGKKLPRQSYDEIEPRKAFAQEMGKPRTTRGTENTNPL